MKRWNHTDVVRQLMKLAIEIPAALRYSRKGTPHLVLTVGKVTYSVACFGSTRKFRVYYPWPTFDQQQTVQQFDRPEGVAAFFEKLKAGQFVPAEDMFTFLPNDGETIKQCNDCGAFAFDAEPVLHFDACKYKAVAA